MVCKVPDEFLPVTREQLEALAAKVNAEQKSSASAGHNPRNNGNPPNSSSYYTPATLAARVESYLAACEPAVSGENGHNKTFGVACRVGPGFDLTQEEAIRAITNHYNDRCKPPWSEREIRHKIEDAYRIETNRGWLLDAKPATDRDFRFAHGVTETTTTAGTFTLDTIDAATFAATHYEMEWLVENFLVAGQTCIVGAPEEVDEDQLDDRAGRVPGERPVFLAKLRSP